MLAKSEHNTDCEFYFHLRAKTNVSPELERFFLMVAGSKDLQQQLKRTKEVADAAQLARDLGFQITDAEVMLAQANRILSIPIRDQEQTALGDQSEFGAQWGRGGQGYLNATGHWLTMMDLWKKLPDCQITRLLKTHSIGTAKKWPRLPADAVLITANFSFFLAQQILTLNDEQLTVMASGKSREDDT
jgi:hypothetical protein